MPVAGRAPPDLPPTEAANEPCEGTQCPPRPELPPAEARTLPVAGSAPPELPPAEAANHFRAGPPQEAPPPMASPENHAGHFHGADAETCIVMA